MSSSSENRQAKVTLAIVWSMCQIGHHFGNYIFIYENIYMQCQPVQRGEFEGPAGGVGAIFM